MDVDDRIDISNSEKITLFHFQLCPDLMNKAAERSLWENYGFPIRRCLAFSSFSDCASKIEEGHHCSQFKYQMIRDDHCTKKYFTYLQFPFLFLLLFFHPVYRLASLISLCTPLYHCPPTFTVHTSWVVLPTVTYHHGNGCSGMSLVTL